MDAPGEIPQLGEGFLGTAVGRAGQQAGAAAVVLPAGPRFEVLLDLPDGHGQRGEADLRAVMQVALDPAEPGSRLVHRASSLFLQFAGALGRCGDPRLRVTLGFQPGGAVLQRGVVGTPVAVGDGVAEHPGGQRRSAQADHRAEKRRTGMCRVRRGPAGNGHRGTEQADHEAGDGDPPWPVRGQGVQQHHDRQVGRGGLQGNSRRRGAGLQAEGDLRGPDRHRGRERRHRAAPARYHGGGEQRADRDGSEPHVDRSGRYLVRAQREQHHRQHAIRLPRMPVHPRPQALQHTPRVGAGARGGGAPPA